MPLLLIIAVLALIKLFTFPLAAEKELGTLTTGFVLRVRLWLLLVKLALGLDVVIVDARRSGAEQNQLHLANPKNPAYDPKNPSSHIAGKAVDVNFKKNGVTVLLKSSTAALWRPVVELGTLCGLRWGGLFPGYADNNHFYCE